MQPPATEHPIYTWPKGSGLSDRCRFDVIPCEEYRKRLEERGFRQLRNGKVRVYSADIRAALHLFFSHLKDWRICDHPFPVVIKEVGKAGNRIDFTP